MRLSYYISKIIKKIHIPAVKNSNISKDSKICPGAHIVRTNIGRHSYVGNFSEIIDSDIGNFCSIADDCSIGAMSHPLNWVSTSPVMYKAKNYLKTNFSNNEYEASLHTVIGNDVWIGAGCRIKAGVKIANGAVLGMGSVLVKDVGPYEIWAGNPAKLIKKRFDDKTIERLLKTEWWDWEDEKIAEYADKFNNPEGFLREQQ